MARRRARCIVIAGPNGAGKTTFAKEFLPREAGVLHFVNADLIAAGLSPLDPKAAQVAAARILLRELDRLAGEHASFAFESTLSGTTYLQRLRKWQKAGYRIEIVFLRLASVDIALRRVAQRVKQGGHNVPSTDVRRRFKRGWANFERLYKPRADSWALYDSSGDTPILIEGTNGKA